MNRLINKKLEEGFYYLQKHNLFIKNKILKVNGRKSLTKFLNIELENGSLDIHKRTIIKTIERPPNVLLQFEWCYELHNQENEFLGYIGKPEIINKKM